MEELARKLNGHGYRAEALHGGMSQRNRVRVMDRFREGAAELLLATDVAARGLDIGRLSHVINYDVPPAPESYVHRIGRTGRAGREGVAITLAEPRERPLLPNIERLTGRRLELAALPTVADLRARRLELTRASLREAVLAGGNEGLRVVVDSLAQEFDVLDVAAAAVKLAHEAGERPAAEEAPAARTQPAAAGRPAAARPARPEAAGPEPARPGTAAPTGEFVRLYVSVGRSSGAWPADLVGAITGEAGIKGREIGTVEIADRYSLVEVREERADEVLQKEVLEQGRMRLLGPGLAAAALSHAWRRVKWGWKLLSPPCRRVRTVAADENAYRLIFSPLIALQLRNISTRHLSSAP